MTGGEQFGVRNFRELLEAQWSRGKFVCVGLDSELKKIPECCRQTYGVADTILAFNRAIIDTTHDVVCAFKPNVAFYEAYGDAGWLALRETVVHIRKVAPEVPVILDAKRADIGNTNNGYVQNIFEFLDVDAVTVNPYLGAEAVVPFLDQKDKGIFVLCRTSNPGAGEFQDLEVHIPIQELEYLQKVQAMPWSYGVGGCTTCFYNHVAYQVSQHWNMNGNCGLVAGATHPGELAMIRKIVGDMPILIPGIGAQGGDLEATVQAGKDSRGQGMIINSSRGIIFASKGPDFAQAARREAIKLHGAINQCLAPPCATCGSVMVRMEAIYKCLNCGATTEAVQKGAVVQ